MFIKKYARVENHAIPNLSWEEQNDKEMEKWYYEKIITLYSSFSKKITTEIINYTKEVQKDEFTALRSI